MLKKLGWNEASQWALSISAEKASVVLQEHMKKLMKERDFLTTECDKMTLENQWPSVLAKKAKIARQFCVKTQRLLPERTMSACAGCPVHGESGNRAKASLSRRFEKSAYC